MQRIQWSDITGFLVKNCKVVFPVILLIASVVTISIALNVRANEDSMQDALSGNVMDSTNISVLPDNQTDTTNATPMLPSEDEKINKLISAYYEAKVTGNMEMVVAISQGFELSELLVLKESSKYIDACTDLEIYVKPGPEVNTAVVYVCYNLMFVNDPVKVPGLHMWYVCINENGELYLNNNDEISDEEKQYLEEVNKQDDVIELYNRVNVEYASVMKNHPQIESFFKEMSDNVNLAVNDMLAALDPGMNEPEPTPEPTPPPQEPIVTVQYAAPNTAVNIRSSASSKSTRLGRVEAGYKLEVQEVMKNGWTKIVYSGKTGYVMTKYLQMIETAHGYTPIGRITATDNVNVRASASEEAGRMGTISAGTTVSLLGIEGGWCKVNYEGLVGYVKADYVKQN